MIERVDLAAQARLVAQLGERTTDAQLGDPTPCEDYAVRHLLGHLVMLSAAFQDVARKELGPLTSGSPTGHRLDVAPGWRDELATNLDGMVAAWRAPEAWEGRTEAGGQSLPGAVAGLVALDELLLHGWDLARATGQPYDPDPDSVRAVHALVSSWAGSGGIEGMFAAPVPVPEGAGLLDQVVALSGRRPDWTPPGG
ncbi:TIGR03086 family metal-binding protein [Streptomyces sp. NPDC056411]